MSTKSERTEYDALIQGRIARELVTMGLARWRSQEPLARVEITAEGMRVVEELERTGIL